MRHSTTHGRNPGIAQQQLPSPLGTCDCNNLKPQSLQPYGQEQQESYNWSSTTNIRRTATSHDLSNFTPKVRIKKCTTSTYIYKSPNAFHLSNIMNTLDALASTSTDFPAASGAALECDLLATHANNNVPQTFLGFRFSC